MIADVITNLRSKMACYFAHYASFQTISTSICLLSPMYIYIDVHLLKKSMPSTHIPRQTYPSFHNVLQSGCTYDLVISTIYPSSWENHPMKCELVLLEPMSWLGSIDVVVALCRQSLRDTHGNHLVHNYGAVLFIAAFTPARSKSTNTRLFIAALPACGIPGRWERLLRDVSAANI